MRIETIFVYDKTIYKHHIMFPCSFSCSGGSVLRMTEHFLTRNVFKTGLNYYLTSSR